MKVKVIKSNDLTEELINIWSEIQKCESTLQSPYFCPTYTMSVGLVRDDIYIAFWEKGDEPVGFFPFQKEKEGLGKPVGMGVCDYQGLIFRKGAEVNVKKLIQGAGLNAWEFDHLITSQRVFKPYHKVVTVSPVIDLSEGYAAYRQGKRNMGSSQVIQIERRLRKLKREVGDVEFKLHTRDPFFLQKLIELKSSQFKRTGAFNKLSQGWIVDLFKRIQQLETKDFAGLLSVLLVNGKPIALHLGMRSQTVWHWWYPVYDTSYAKYSPGLILILEMAKYAQTLGVGLIDLGKDTFLYKQRLMNNAIEIAEGIVDIR